MGPRYLLRNERVHTDTEVGIAIPQLLDRWDWSVSRENRTVHTDTEIAMATSKKLLDWWSKKIERMTASGYPDKF